MNANPGKTTQKHGSGQTIDLERYSFFGWVGKSHQKIWAEKQTTPSNSPISFVFLAKPHYFLLDSLDISQRIPIDICPRKEGI